MIAGKEKIAEYFEGLLEKYGDDFRSLDWNSKDSQLVRFSALLDILSYVSSHKTNSILDVGCGIGHFYEFLNDSALMKALKISYSGIDISKKMIEFARNKFSGIDFKVVDLINDKFDKKYDYVMCSGAFNIRMSDIASHKNSVKQMLSRMYGICDHGVSVNFLAQSAIYLVPEGKDIEADRYVYFTEEEVTGWVRAICDRFVLRRDYHPGDFTVYMLK